MLHLVFVISLWTEFIAMNPALSSHLRLYDSFSEIHQIYNGPLRFRQSDWENIKHESIVLRLASNQKNLSISFERRITRIHLNMTGLFNKRRYFHDRLENFLSI